MRGGAGSECAAAVRGMAVALPTVLVLVVGWGSEAVEARISRRREGACCSRSGAARELSTVGGGSHTRPGERFQRRQKAEEEVAEAEVEAEVAAGRRKTRDGLSCSAVSPTVDANLASSERPWLVAPL